MAKLLPKWWLASLVTISSTVFGNVSWSQNSASSVAAALPTTLPSAIERAVLQNPEVKMRFHALQGAEYDRAAGQGAWWPRVDLEAATGPKQTLTPALPATRNYNSSHVQVQLRQTLFDGFATSSEVRRLGYTHQAAYYDFLGTSNQIALEAARAYLDVLRYRQLVDLAAANFTVHMEVYDRINQKVSAGVGRRVDLEQAAGRLALAESNWLTETSNLHDVSSRYQRLVGELPAPNLAAVPPLDAYLPKSTAFISDAMRKNPEFLSSIATIRAFRADLAARKAPNYPTLELRARQSHETNQNGAIGDYRDTALELVLNYNLFRGGTDMNRAKQYAAKLSTAFDLRDKTCRDVQQTGQIAYNDTVRLVSQIKLLAQHELSTAKARQAYQQQFDIGQRSLLDLLDTDNELYQARRALSNAETDFLLAKVRVMSISGSLLSALKLRTLSDEVPAQTDDQEDADEAQLCNLRAAQALNLDRSFEPRLLPAASTPAASTPEAICRAELPKVVETWMAAWNNKDFATYLASYDAAFVPANGMNRSAWEVLRKNRINKKGSIKLLVSEIQPIACEAKVAEVSFSQTYESSDYDDTVEKTLSLVRVDKAWKIVKETVTKGRTF
jgi:outer membrane protein, adhesin transport system